ncbi:MAG: MFS transporter [Oscillospiraceae bacterium]
MRYDEKSLISVKEKGEKAFMIIEKKALPASMTIIFMAFSSASAFGFVPLLGNERGIAGISIFYTFSALGLLISRVAGLGASRKFGESTVFYAGALGYAISFLFLAFAFTRPIVCVAGFLYGCGSGFAHPILNAIAVRSVQPNRRGAATSTFMMSQDIGMAIGSTVWGFASGYLGFTAVYVMAAINASMMLVTFKLILSKTAQPKLSQRV